MSKLSIIIPAYNEADTISHVLDRILQVNLVNDLEKEVIIVDDCSKDDTARRIEVYRHMHANLNIRYFKNVVNSGKGYSVRQGISNATGDYLIIQDADLEYDPQEYNVLLQPMLFHNADVVYGSRFMSGSAHRILFFWHSFGNRFLTFLSNMLTNLNLTDMETGYKLFRRSVFSQMILLENRFGFEPEVTAKIAKIGGIRIFEVGISYYGRTYHEGKKINWKDGFRAIYCFVRYNLFS